MSRSWTSQQVIALAPDEASAKAGRQLATAAKWPMLGCSQTDGRAAAVWGECAGSGKKPYQVRIDLGPSGGAGPAFKCSCPSRKFPCKHALGLFLLLADRPDLLEAGEPPAWVADWLASRQERQQQKAEKAAEKKPPDPEQKAKREARRAGRIGDGLDVLEMWLVDLVTEGLASAPARPGAFWRDTAAAMVNAQAPGLARMAPEAGAPTKEARQAPGLTGSRRLPP